MSLQKHFFEKVTLLVTHYNRSESLEKLLNRFQELNCYFGDMVISDDGSKIEHLNYLIELQSKHKFRLVTSKINKGLGNNINKGQDAVKTPYTLYIQEDLHPTNAFLELFPKSLEVMEKDSNMDLIRFFAYFGYPNVTPYDGEFSEMNFNLLFPGYYKFYKYSDSSHLRRSSFFKKFGKYQEGTNSDDAEYRMCLSFLKCEGRALLANKYHHLFDHVNTSDEPSTANFRKEWKSSKSIPVQILRSLYLQYKIVKYHSDFLFHKPLK